MAMTKKERRDFQQYLRQCTDAQVRGVYEKEKKAGRWEEVDLAHMEALARGISVAD